MSSARRGRLGRRDQNEPEIITALLAIGATVLQINKTNTSGVCDLVVGFKGVNYCLEVKPSKGKLTPDESKWHSTWQGQKAVVHSVEEALRAIGAIDV